MKQSTHESRGLDPLEVQEQLTAMERQLDQQAQFIRHLEANERRLRLAVDSTGLGLWDWNIPTGALLCNNTWSEMLGYFPGELPPSAGSWRKLLHPEDEADVHSTLVAHLAGESPLFHSEHRLKKRCGEWVWILDQGRVVEWDAAGLPLRMVGTHRDITERKAREFEMHQQAIRDPLTQLLNRRGLEQQFQRLQRQSREQNAPFGIGYVDVNEFKGINDCYGHAAGDAVLQEVAIRLTSVVRSDDLVARYGGDEFVLLLSHMHGPEELQRISQRVAAVAQVPILCGGQPLAVSLSLGVALCQNEETSLKQLLAQADRKMYQTKQRSVCCT